MTTLPRDGLNRIPNTEPLSTSQLNLSLRTLTSRFLVTVSRGPLGEVYTSIVLSAVRTSFVKGDETSYARKNIVKQHDGRQKELIKLTLLHLENFYVKKWSKTGDRF